MRFLPLIFFICLKGNSQEDTVNCFSKNIISTDSISVFIKGKKDVKSIKRKFFHEKFELITSDPSFKIVSFRIVWDKKRKIMLIERMNYGSLVRPEIEDAKMENRETYSLKNLEPGSLLSFDCIIIKKGDTYYKAPPIIISVSL